VRNRVNNNKVPTTARNHPSQIRRDQDRAKQLKEKQKQNQASVENELLEHSDSMSVCENVNLNRPSENIVDQIVAAATRPFSISVSPGQQAGAYACIRPSKSTCSDSQSETTTQPTPQREVLSEDCVRDYVATIKDKKLRKNLSVSSRNQTFSKVSVNSNNDVLVCESDDVVVEFDYNKGGGAGCVSFWYIKQPFVNLLPDERPRVTQLMFGREVDKSEHRTAIAHATNFLHQLGQIVQRFV
jgi:hypothetical protein